MIDPVDRVALAMSGGVDSTVAAALLLRQGLRPQGVHLRLFAGGPPRAHLEALARGLGIPLTEMDLSREFTHRVIDYFVSEYSRGRTPNPCVQCNAGIKFGRLWELLRAQGISRLATGHYARLKTAADGALGLYRGVDRRKDQSYFLSRLPRELLPHLLFPLGEMTKTEVRRHFRDLHLPVNERPESVELCFITQGSYQDFIQARCGPGTPGELVDLEGHILGRHRGLEHYTVGQRRGLGVPAREPYYVAEIHPGTNRVVLGYKQETMSAGLRAVRLNWLIEPPGGELQAQAVIRYRHPGVAAQIAPLRPGEVEVIFAMPQSAVAPGQAVVFYDRDDRVLGGGWIEERIK
jgi:tRNA-uridine 2-sulfurtransferase